MNIKVIPLREDDPSVTLTAYIPDDSKEYKVKTRRAIIIFPGGGYHFCSDREAEPVAFRFMGEGFTPFILRYSLNENAVEPRQLVDASNAVAHVRLHAEEYRIFPDKIVLCGFSAGGHLAASLGTMWHTDYAKISPDMPYGINRPDGMILCYPVIHTAIFQPDTSEYGKKEYGDRTTEVGAKTSRLDQQVDERTVPAYIWTTYGDKLVPPENSLYFALALQKAKIPYELHIFRRGWHGLSLSTREVSGEKGEGIFDDVSTWVNEAVAWAKAL